MESAPVETMPPVDPAFSLEAVVLPAPEAAEPTPTPAEASGIFTPDQRTPAERGALLLKQARTAASGDATDRTHDLTAVFKPAIWVGGTAASAFVATAVAESPGRYFSASVTAIGVLIGEVARMGYREYRNPEELHLNDGYALQCLRVNKRTHAVPDGEVAVVVLPRDYKGESKTAEPEPPELSRQRLAQAMDTIAEAAANDKKGTIGTMIIPAQAARNAGLPVKGAYPYYPTIKSMKGRDTYSQSYYHEGSVITAPVAMAAKFAALARAERTPASDEAELFRQVMARLELRFPAKQGLLHEDNKAVVPLLHGLIRETLDASTGVLIHRRGTANFDVLRRGEDGEPLIGESGKEVVDTVNGLDGSVVRARDSVITYLDTKSKYNPLVTRQMAQSLQSEGQARLRDIVGGRYTPDPEEPVKVETVQTGLEGLSEVPEEPNKLEILKTKLERELFDDLQLLSIALEFLERKEKAAEQPAPAPVEKAAKPLPLGEYSKSIMAAEGGNWPAVKRFLGRTAVASALLAIASTATYDFVHEDEKPPAPPRTAAIAGDGKTTSSEQQLWRVENHGLQEDSAYWRQYAYYRFENGKWDGSMRDGEAVTMPGALPDPKTPHKTVTTVTSNMASTLTIQQNTAVGAIRAFTTDNQGLKVQLYNTEDNRMYATVANQPSNSFYRLEYDLVEAVPDQNFHPVKPVTVDAKGELPDPVDYPGKADFQEYTSNNFTYDNGPDLKRQLAGKDAKEYVDYVYSQERCQCLQCNTAAGILTALQQPHAHMAMVNGYLHGETTGPNDVGYLTGNQYHAWMDDGTVEDATAKKTDPNSHVSEGVAAKTADELWHTQLEAKHLASNQVAKAPEQPSPWRGLVLPLAEMALIGAAAFEVRKKYLSRAIAEGVTIAGWQSAHSRLDVRDAVQLMNWHAYGGNRQMPAVSKGQNYKGEQVEMLSDRVVLDVAVGYFRGNENLTKRERRGLVKAAKAISRERVRADRSSR